MAKDTLYTCALCGLKFVGQGNNPSPILDGGKGHVCCDECNVRRVIPERMRRIAYGEGRTQEEFRRNQVKSDEGV